MNKLAVSIICALTITVFQNCANESSVYSTTMSSSRGNANDPNKLIVGAAVWPRTDSEITNPVPLNITKAALPLAIDFSLNPLYVDGNVTWGFWIRSWKQYSPADMAYFGQPKYSYRLDMFKNAVVDLASQTVIYQLNKHEAQKLKTMLAGAILANAQQFSATSTCTPSDADNYASLETDYGIFDLGAGAPCSVVDLFKNNNSGQVSGMQQFLTHIQGKF